jgi:hypothetical protein
MAVESLAQFFGTRRVSSHFESTVTKTTQEWTSADTLAEERRDARIVGGMHFRSSMAAGERLGADVAHRVGLAMLTAKSDVQLSATSPSGRTRKVVACKLVPSGKQSLFECPTKRSVALMSATAMYSPLLPTGALGSLEAHGPGSES